MKKIFAIDPDAPADYKDFKAISDHFGFHTGRFIADFPRNWAEQIQKREVEFHGVRRSIFVDLLKRYAEASIAVRAGYVDTAPWSDNVVNSKKQFDAILAKNPNIHGLPTLDEFLWSSLDLDAGRGARVRQTVEEYMNVFEPLLQKSSELHFVDRYLRFRKRDRPDTSMFELFRGVCEVGGAAHLRFIVLHVGVDDKYGASDQQKAQLRDDIKEIESQLGQSKIRFSVKWADRFAPGKDWHPRYLISIKGGIKIDQGFNFDPRRTNHLVWLSRQERELILRSIGC